MITATAFSIDLLGDDVARLQVGLDGLDQHARRFRGGRRLLGSSGWPSSSEGQAHAQRLEGRRHRVGGVHAAARAAAGDGAALDLAEVLLAHLAGAELADGLEDADDVQVLALVAAGQDGAAVDVDGGHVGAQHAHHAAGHVLVAAADDEHAVHPLAADAGLDAVGDDLARDQAVLHALGAHRHAVADGGRAEDLRVGAGGLDPSTAASASFCRPELQGVIVAVAVGDADHRLAEVALA
jgi:hypothetical protein